MSAPPEHRLRVMIVEDDIDQREALVHSLREPAIETCAVGTGEEAIDYAKRNRVDLVILDIGLPDMSGLDVCKALQTLACRHPLVMFLTGSATHGPVHGLEHGAVEFLSKPVDPAELLARVNALLRVARRVDDLTSAASTDALTGLRNRAALEAMRLELENAPAASLQRLSVCMLDIDHFKRVNDRYGHRAGDQALRIIAQRIQKSVRLHDFVYRYGGEEFTALMPDTRRGDAGRVAERIRARVAAEPIFIRDNEKVSRALPMTISAGVATKDAPVNLGELLLAADAALQRAKASGRDRVQSFHAE